jgi:hypothetical protein
MDGEYAAICGISAEELTANFDPELHAPAKKNDMTYDEALAEMQKRYNGYHFAGGITIDAQSIYDYRGGGASPVPILYQSGYLTIKSYNRQLDEYTLGFPNGEVEYGFLHALLPSYMRPSGPRA